mmetsp:Transcript_90970/g.136264  ORF Transcript_90970/g.136264 Transcript_90970/m.136264 type:complete len:95 (-) Transcript_90970:16-300(-)
MAAALTAIITISLTAYAMTTKKDITIFGGLLFSLSSGLLVGSIFFYFFPNNMLEYLVLLGGALVYSVYIIYDTMLIVGGKRFEIDIDDYIMGAM